eukprot:TRINITY_DN6416_c0_g1_i2.p1 TRINITY_DN6416_c0_g1~~TRINITY_DN6416_c0_g1_i2.p1  ORF type:complete len:306 (+),score=36.35 TRINITY_DN6416_c0_g1_i2:316-1233(+)
MQSIMDNSSNQPNANSSRFTMAGGTLSAKSEQNLGESKRASIYYGALRVPVKTAAPTPGRVARLETQPTPGGLLTSARRVEVKTPGGGLSQTPSRRQTSYGQQSTPGRFPLTSGVSRMNTMTSQAQNSFDTPLRQLQATSIPSPSLQKKPVVVEETYIRRLTYDDAEQYDDSQYPYGDTVHAFSDNFEQQSPPQTVILADEPPRPVFDKEALHSQKVVTQPLKPTSVLQRQVQEPEHSATKERKVQFQEPSHAPLKTEHPESSSRDEVEKRLISNQRRRRELMTELQRLDAEQMELITQLQALPK